MNLHDGRSPLPGKLPERDRRVAAHFRGEPSSRRGHPIVDLGHD